MMKQRSIDRKRLRFGVDVNVMKHAKHLHRSCYRGTCLVLGGQKCDQTRHHPRQIHQSQCLKLYPCGCTRCMLWERLRLGLLQIFPRVWPPLHDSPSDTSLRPIDKSKSILVYEGRGDKARKIGIHQSTIKQATALL